MIAIKTVQLRTENQRQRKNEKVMERTRR